MKTFLSRFGVLAMALMLSACSGLGSAGGPVKQDVIAKVSDFIVKDAARGEEIATKYNAPEIATCLHFVQGAFTQSNTLMSEDTNGLLSLSVKLYLLKKQTSGNQAAEQEFKDKCGSVAAGLMLEAAKSAPMSPVGK
jgi:hypothetical protein